MALRRILTGLFCLAALPALADATCPERFRIVGWPGGTVTYGQLGTADFKGGPVIVTGADVADAVTVMDMNGAPAVQFKLTAQGARAFGDHTRAHIGEQIAIIYDEALLTAPIVREAITGGQGIITGGLTVRETNEIAAQLRDKSCPAGS